MAIKLPNLKDSILDPILDPFEILPGTSSHDKAAEEAFRVGQEAYEGIEVPDIIDTDYFAPEDVGGYDPSLVSYTPIEDTAFSDIALDPRLQNEQYDMLAALDDIINGGGMSATGRASLNKALSSAATEDRGRREAILQNMQARGMGGSGMELLSQLQSSQAATDRANQSGLDIAAMEEQNVLNAIMNSGNLAGDMQDADWRRKAEAAAARDALNKFNTTNTFAGSKYNADAQTQAARDRVNQRQSLANAQAGAKNAGIDSRIGQTQDQFKNKIALAGGKQGLAQQAQGYHTGKEDERIKKKAGISQGLLTAGKALAGGGF